MSISNVPWWIALVAWMGACTYWHVCEIKELCDAPLLGAARTEATGGPLWAEGVKRQFVYEGIAARQVITTAEWEIVSRKPNECYSRW